jgi:hypothetical protein
LECWNVEDPPLEGWNIGKMGMGYWIVGLMVIVVLTTKFKMDNILRKTHYSIIPLFHYSMIEAEDQA